MKDNLKFSIYDEFDNEKYSISVTGAKITNQFDNADLKIYSPENKDKFEEVYQKYYDNYLLINDDKRRKITKDSLITALTITNPTPSKIQRENIWGPSYVYGIITDKRIKGF